MKEFNATKYKNEYTKKNYDRTSILFPKGEKAIIEEYVKSQGYKSLNAYINTLIATDMKNNLEEKRNGKVH